MLIKYCDNKKYLGKKKIYLQSQKSLSIKKFIFTIYNFIIHAIFIVTIVFLFF